MAVSVNLLPDLKQQRLKAQRRKRNMVLIALVVMAIGVALPVVAGLTIGTQTVILNNYRNSNENGIEQLHEVEGLNEALTAQSQLDEIYNLRDSGENFNGFFSFLEKALPQETRLTSVEISSDGVLEISGVARNVDAVNVVVQSLTSYTPDGLNLDKFDAERQTFISTVNVKSISPDAEEGASFRIEAQFNFATLEAKAQSSDAVPADDEAGSTNPFSEGDN